MSGASPGTLCGWVLPLCGAMLAGASADGTGPPEAEKANVAYRTVAVKDVCAGRT